MSPERTRQIRFQSQPPGWGWWEMARARGAPAGTCALPGARQGTGEVRDGGGGLIQGVCGDKRPDRRIPRWLVKLGEQRPSQPQFCHL